MTLRPHLTTINTLRPFLAAPSTGRQASDNAATPDRPGGTAVILSLIHISEPTRPY